MHGLTKSENMGHSHKGTPYPKIRRTSRINRCNYDLWYPTLITMALPTYVVLMSWLSHVLTSFAHSVPPLHSSYLPKAPTVVSATTGAYACVVSIPRQPDVAGKSSPLVAGSKDYSLAMASCVQLSFACSWYSIIEATADGLDGIRGDLDER